MAERRRDYKRLPISDQQRRRDAALERQKQERRDLQLHFRRLASTLSEEVDQADAVTKEEKEDGEESDLGIWNLLDGSNQDARSWFARQFMLPEWMIDTPPDLSRDWYVLPRPAGKRCLVISARGSTVSRLRNGRVLHRFPSYLPNGARTANVSAPAHVFCILDCVFHEADQTYYIIDLTCWRGYPLYDCATDFRFFWRDSKLAETDVFSLPSSCHRYRFSVVPVYECNLQGLQAAYSGPVPFVRDGILFYNRHAHYDLGYTPLALLWKDPFCSQYYLDTDANGQVPSLQKVVLELKQDGSVATSDDPPVILGTMPKQFLEENAKYLKPGTLLRFSIATDGLKIVDAKPVAAAIHYEGPANRYRPAADSCTKILFQYAARHSPISYADIVAALEASGEDMQ